MEIVLYFIIAVLAISLIIVFFKKDVKRANIDYDAKEQELIARLHQKEVEGLAQINIELENERTRAYQERLRIHEHLTKEQETLKNYKNAKIADIENQIELYKQEELHKIKETLLIKEMEEKRKQEVDLLKISQEYTEQKEKLNREITEAINILQDLKEKREHTINIIKEEEKIKNEADFYRIVLSDEDISDIRQLRAIEKYLNNKDVLRKLIYKTFVETPMNEMLNRIGAKGNAGIYKITNLKNNMCYIGQSTNVRNRLKAHVQASLGISTIANQLVHDKIAEDGIDQFSFQIVEESDKEQLNSREKYWIEYYDSTNYGYNKTGGNKK